ncbi:MAG: endonuclease domain-containing protein [Gibbsiella quercinecans]|uniref:endonuclease domain-containing protein n=1 Tax=Gibbsiella quercinecans TaxID=929813 RepID=UPI003F325DDA
MEKSVLQNARRLRAMMTPAEKTAWLGLRDRRLGGYKFRRQLPIGPYIVDFVCLQRKLIVELDGGQHMEQAGYDARRTRYLEQHGFKVLRFWNNEVFDNWSGVQAVILQHLCEGPPHPGPLPKGEGALG